MPRNVPIYRLRLTINNTELCGIDIPVTPSTSEEARVKMMHQAIQQLVVHVSKGEILNPILTAMVWETIKHRGQG